MTQHAWRTLVFLFAIGEALHLTDTYVATGALLRAHIYALFALLFMGYAMWNVWLAIRALLCTRRPLPNLNDAELNDGLSDEDVA